MGGLPGLEKCPALLAAIKEDGLKKAQKTEHPGHPEADREKLVHILPEFALIANRDLREKTVNVWLEALRRGGWSIEDLSRIPFTLALKGVTVSILEHTRCVTCICAEVAGVFGKLYGKRLSLDKDILMSGAILHDVGKLLEFKESGGAFSKSAIGRLVRHPVSGAALCFELGLPAEVVHVVASHGPETDPAERSPEAVILHHADTTNFQLLL